MNADADWTAVLAAHAPGDVLQLEVKRRGGDSQTVTVTLAANPALEVVRMDAGGGEISAAEAAFREAWLGPAT